MKIVNILKVNWGNYTFKKVHGQKKFYKLKHYDNFFYNRIFGLHLHVVVCLK